MREVRARDPSGDERVRTSTSRYVGCPPAATRWRRALAAAALVAVPFVMAEVNTWSASHATVKALVSYSPERFVHGAVWTLPLSALITATIAHIRLDILVTILLMVPYLLLAGALRTIVRFFAGHIGCTLATLVVVTIGSAAGWTTATTLYSRADVGVSAGAAAVGGAFAVLLWRTRLRWLAVPALVIPLYFYTYRFATEPAAAVMADSEHLIAFAIGIAIELHWPMRSWPERPTATTTPELRAA